MNGRNPLLENRPLPDFAHIDARHVEPAIDTVLAKCRAELASLLQQQDYSWDNLVAPVELMQDRLERVWSPVRHLNHVVNNPDLRKAYNACLAKLSDYATELGQNDALYQAFRQVAEQLADSLDGAQKKLLENALRDFRLAGVHLPAAEKARFKELMQKLSALQSKFEENLLDATDAWTKHITDPAHLEGIPPTATARAAETAQAAGKSGWLFGLDYPTFHAIAAHAKDADLRRELYEAWTTRASDRGPCAGRFDNSDTMEQILAVRHELAEVLGFSSYADMSLATKMAESPDDVTGFLQDLAGRSVPVAQKEFAVLEKFAGHPLQAWDVAYYTERLRQQRFEIDDESLRPYFPTEKAIAGLFDVAGAIYGVTFREADASVWHESVGYYEIIDANGNPQGSFFTDLYARSNKRGGAWMDECMSRHGLTDTVQNPVAYLVCNFSPPVADGPATLTHNEIVTLFHEFGHTLHHLLTRVDYPSVSGISGVAWDAVELPSQFMENFVWTDEVLPMISGHIDSGEPLPRDLFESLLGTRRFMAGMGMVRQLEFALFDMRLHQEYTSDLDLYGVLDDVRRQVAVVPAPEFNRFPHGFAHVFAGGYAAGYYSYKWAEVLSADAFSAFEEEGVLNRDTGERFKNSVLEVGGSRDAMEAFVSFRGREPTLDALLRHSGILAEDHAA